MHENIHTMHHVLHIMSALEDTGCINQFIYHFLDTQCIYIYIYLYIYVYISAEYSFFVGDRILSYNSFFVNDAP